MKKLAIIALSLAVCGTASAQGFNPVVEVTNAFEGKIMEVQKNELEMAVPDSLLRFDYEFDYTTFENPYKGAYDFSPYQMNMTPEPRAYDGKKLYLKLGAGYMPAPEARLVWSPEFKGKLKDKFSIVVEDDFNGYWGRYFQFKGEKDGNALVYNPSKDSFVNGHDMDNTLRLSALLDAGKASVSAGVEWSMVNSLYPGAHMQDVASGSSWRNRNDWNNLGGNLGVHSKGHGRVFANLDLAYNRGWNDSDYRYYAKQQGAEDRYDVNARIGTRLGKPGTMAYLDVYVGHEKYVDGLNYVDELVVNQNESNVAYSADYNTRLTNISFTPTLSGHIERLNYMVGMNLSLVLRKYSVAEYNFDDILVSETTSPKEMGRLVYPQFHADYEIVKEVLKIYANFGGGNHLDSYASMVSDRHFLLPVHMGDLGVENVCEKYSVNAGFSGRIHARLQYDIQGGVRRVDNIVSDMMDSSVTLPMYSKIGCSRSDQRIAFAKTDVSWTSEHVDIKAGFRYEDVKLIKGEALLPSAFSGSFAAVYNWNKRIFAGLSLNAASSRHQDGVSIAYIEDLFSSAFIGEDALLNSIKIPGYVDLGLNAEYKCNNRLSVWASCGNLVGNAIHKELLYARKGRIFTLGLCLNL